MYWDWLSGGFNAFRCYSLIFIAALTSLFLSSCASSERMMRLSPFRHQQGIKLEPTGQASSSSQIKMERHSGADDFDARFKNHVNLWPMLYSEGNFTSIFWPMIDFDPQGMAVRPFYNRERNEYSILFPLSAWNPQNGDGWLLTGYWDKPAGDYGIFPLYHIGKDKQQELKDLYLLSFLLGHYSAKGKDGYRFSALNYLQGNYNNNFFSSLLPLYYYSYEDNKSFLWFLNSFYNRDSKEDTIDFTFLPISYYQSEPDRVDFWLLNGYYGKDEEETRHLIFPLYWYYNDDSEYWMNFLIFSGFKYDNSLRKLWFMPLFYYDDEGFSWIMMFYQSSEGRLGFFPLFDYKSEVDSWYLSVWPLLSYSKSTPTRNSGHLLLCFMGYDFLKKHPGNTAWIWPLFYYDQQQKNDPVNIFPFLFKKINHTYHPNTPSFKSEDLQKAGIPQSTKKSFEAIIFQSREEHYYNFSFPGEKLLCSLPGACSPFKGKAKNSYEFTIFPFIRSRKEFQKWDENKLDHGIKSLEDRLKRLRTYKNYLKNHDKLMKRLAKHEFGSKFNFCNKIFKLNPMPPDFKAPGKMSLKEQEKAYIKTQLESFKRQSQKGILKETTTIKTILKDNGCGDVNISSKPELLKALYGLQERNSILTKETLTMLFPLFSRWYSPEENGLWLMPFYSSGNTVKKSITNGLFPLYHYHSSPEENQLILWPLLSYGSSKQVPPDCGFPSSIFSESMKNAGLKNGKKTSTLSLLICPTESEKKVNILPMPDTNRLKTQSYQQTFWLFNRWGETCKSWKPSKLKQIRELLTTIATLVDLKYWSPGNTRMKAALKFSASSFKPCYKIKLPKDRDRWIRKTETRLRQSLSQFGYSNIDIKSKDALIKLLVEIDRKYTIQKKSSHILIPPLFYHHTNDNDEYWNILLLLSDYEKKGSYSKFSILKYLLRMEEKNDKFSCDVFPFINYSSENNRSSFSFMWRLFRMEKSKTETNSSHKLYLFFIPFEW